jgi:hypothetical protein
MAEYKYSHQSNGEEFDAYVEDSNGNTIWQVHYPELIEDMSTGDMMPVTTIFDEGHMKGSSDVEGLENYLKMKGILQAEDELVSEHSSKSSSRGSIPNNYAGKSAETIWNELTENQRLHFLIDHAEELSNGISTQRFTQIIEQDWNDLDYHVQIAFQTHKMMGQYAKGGITPKLNEQVIERAKEIYNVKGGKSKSDFDKAYNQAIEEFGYTPSYFKKVMSNIGSDDYDEYEDFEEGGSVEQGNVDMLKNQVIQVEHHAKELMETLKSNPQVDAWVVAKMDRATSNLSDITHYLEGEQNSFEDGGETDDEEEDENQKRLEELVEEYDIPEEVIKEYASDRGIDISEIDDLPFQGRFDSEEDYAEDAVEQGVVGNLSYYLYMTDTDKRLLAQEEADNRVDNMDDDDLLRESDLETEADDYDRIKDDIDNLESEIDDLKSEIDDIYSDEDEDTTEADREKNETKASDLRDELDTKEFELEKLQDELASYDTRDELVEKAKDNLRDDYYNDIYDQLDKDAVSYFTDELGYAEEDLAKNNLFSIDYEFLAKELGYDVLYIEHNGDVYVFSNSYASGGVMADGGTIGDRVKVSDFTNYAYYNTLEQAKEYADTLRRMGYEAIVTESPSGYEAKHRVLWKKTIRDNTNEKRVYADGGMMAKGGNVPSIEKRVAEVNALIKEGNDKGLEVVDESTTWQSPMKYKPFKYSNGVLYEEYEELDLYSHNRGEGTKWKTKKYKFTKNSSFGIDDQKGVLNQVARMYRKAIKHFNTYGYAKGGESKKFKKVRTLAEAEKDPRVEKIYFEPNDYTEKEGSWWIELKEGYICRSMSCGTIHEDTLKQVLDLLNNDVVEGTEENGYAKGGKLDTKTKKEIYQEWERFKNGKKGGSPFGHIRIWTSLKGMELSDDELSAIIKEGKTKYDDGGVTFDDKVKSISKSLLKRKKVSPKVQKDYGKTYNKKEAIESAKRIAGSIRKKEMGKEKK